MVKLIKILLFFSFVPQWRGGAALLFYIPEIIGFSGLKTLKLNTKFIGVLEQVWRLNLS